MADIRILAWVTARAVQAGAKVILVGDHRQLPEVGAGGGFAYAAATSPAVAKLTRNRRQRAGWEIDALNHLRDGSIPKAVAHYHHHNRVVVQPDRATMIHDATTRWMQATANGETCVLATGTNDLARALNHAVLEQLIASRQLSDTPGLFGDQRYWPGQQVIVRTNYTALHGTRVTNGQILTVTSIGGDTITLVDAGGTAVELDGRFLDRGGRIDHGYAVTTYRTRAVPGTGPSLLAWTGCGEKASTPLCPGDATPT